MSKPYTVKDWLILLGRYPYAATVRFSFDDETTDPLNGIRFYSEPGQFIDAFSVSSEVTICLSCKPNCGDTSEGVE